VDGAHVYPRVVWRRSFELNAAAVIFAHNHLSGSTDPSMADTRVTERLKQALGLVDVRVLDHLIVGTAGARSLAEAGLL
jgi:DNA repair protein RadC